MATLWQVGWRLTLILILLLTLVGSVVLAVKTPSDGSTLGVLGALGSLMGAFVTTGLDIAGARAERRDRAAVPQVDPSHIAETVRRKPLSAYAEPSVLPRPRRKTGFLGPILKASTIGSALLGVFGLLFALPVIEYVMCCASGFVIAVIGIAYTHFANRELGPDGPVSLGKAMAGGALAGMMPAVVGYVARSLSYEVMYGSSAALAQYLGATSDAEAVAYVAFIKAFGVCLNLMVVPLISGLAAAAFTAMGRSWYTAR